MLQQHLSHTLEIIFQSILLKRQARSLQETIFKVVQVPQDTAFVKLGLRVAHTEVQSFGTPELHLGQQTYGFFQQRLLLVAELMRQSSFFYGLEEQQVAQILLNIIHLVIAFRHHLRHRQPFFLEMPGHCQEGPVFLLRFPLDANQRRLSFQSEIQTVGARRRHFLYLLGFMSCIGNIQLS